MSWPSLTTAYQTAHELVDGFALKGMDDPVFPEIGITFGVLNSMLDMMSSDPTWSPSFGSRPTQPDPPRVDPVDVALRKQIKIEQERIRRKLHRREANRFALEKLYRGKNWEQELQIQIEESQAAQTGAIRAVLKLMIGEAGPVRDRIEVHERNFRRLWKSVQKIRPQFKKLSVLKGAPAKHSATLRLRRLYNEWTKAMGTEWKLAEMFKNLHKTADLVMKVTEEIELVRELREKHNFLLATKTIPAYLVASLKDAFLGESKRMLEKELLRRGAKSLVRGLSLANFFIDYGFNSLKFYYSWRGVNDILGRIEDDTASMDTLRTRIKNTTIEIKRENLELRRLKEAQRSKEGGRELLKELRDKERRAAMRAGELFLQQSPIPLEWRAPGRPIFR